MNYQLIQITRKHLLYKNKTQTQILCSQYIAEISLSRVNEQEESDQIVMTLFPALNLEALLVAADTLIPRFIPAIPKIVTKITSDNSLCYIIQIQMLFHN
ncbi:Hypothetical_protein [Hexamita inflata]|uniref:Hypothetical_protein n=1 Tax=Hexamita inflata TaxID=28002 RepID=A0AA86QF45_9EUKA|nr:Hypothetical protein HINF_LOCUS43346 [Hexamita inflata]